MMPPHCRRKGQADVRWKNEFPREIWTVSALGEHPAGSAFPEGIENNLPDGQW